MHCQRAYSLSYIKICISLCQTKSELKMLQFYIKRSHCIESSIFDRLDYQSMRIGGWGAEASIPSRDRNVRKSPRWGRCEALTERSACFTQVCQREQWTIMPQMMELFGYLSQPVIVGLGRAWSILRKGMTTQELLFGDLFWQPCLGWLEGGGANTNSSEQHLIHEPLKIDLYSTCSTHNKDHLPVCRILQIHDQLKPFFT